jgi:hypothetical protein
MVPAELGAWVEQVDLKAEVAEVVRLRSTAPLLLAEEVVEEVIGVALLILPLVQAEGAEDMLSRIHMPSQQVRATLFQLVLVVLLSQMAGPEVLGIFLEEPVVVSQIRVAGVEEVILQTVRLVIRLVLREEQEALLLEAAVAVPLDRQPCVQVVILAAATLGEVAVPRLETEERPVRVVALLTTTVLQEEAVPVLALEAI